MLRLRGVSMGLAVAMGLAGGAADAAERLTYTKDIAPILNENCVSCHRAYGANLSGMVAPMAFSNYREVRPWAKAIRKAVEAKTMPPWHASEETHGVFKNERTLTADQIQTIVDWVDQGASRGNPADMPPPPPAKKAGWTIGEPDLILGFPEPYFVSDDVQDIQPAIRIEVTEEMLPEPRWIKAIEFQPGSEVVHHIVAFTLDPDNEDALERRKMIGRIAPGTDAQRYDEGYGFLLRPNTSVTLAMHYHKEAGAGTGVYDSSLMGIKFHENEVTHPVEISAISHGAFEVPPFHPNWRVGGARVFEDDFIIVDLMPHTHLRGAAAKYTAHYPDGSVEVLLNVPRYDYNWQTGYEYDEYKWMPAGTRIEWEIIYDNSEANAEEDGFNPARAVRFGGPTTEEMDLGFITYALAEARKTPEAFGAGE